MTQEESWKAIQDVAYLAACVVNGTTPDTQRVKGMDLEQLYPVAKRHLLSSITAFGLEAAGVQDTRFSQAKAKAIRKVALLDAEMTNLFEKLDEAGIWHMPLKGTVLQQYYPKYGMREMSDHDILFDATRAADVKAIMEGLGFSTESYNKGNHDIYHKEPVVNFEMHRELFGAGSKKQLRDYYHNVEERLVKGAGFARRFTPEDFYIYMIAHEYKHFAGGGTGLRSLLDTYVLERKLGSSLNRDYIRQELDKLGLTEFEAKNRALSLHLFGGVPLTEEEQGMLSYVLSSGAYGTMHNHVENEITEKGRFGYFLSRLTLPKEMMEQQFPVLKKAPALYPFFWMFRLLRGFFANHKVFMYQLKAVFRRKKK